MKLGIAVQVGFQTPAALEAILINKPDIVVVGHTDRVELLDLAQGLESVRGRLDHVAVGGDPGLAQVAERPLEPALRRRAARVGVDDVAPLRLVHRRDDGDLKIVAASRQRVPQRRDRDLVTRRGLVVRGVILVQPGADLGQLPLALSDSRIGCQPRTITC
jgi:hypothetical protein